MRPAVESDSGTGNGKSPSGTRLSSTEITIDGNGRISPSQRLAEEGRGATCVMCRAQVAGWLRVYPG